MMKIGAIEYNWMWISYLNLVCSGNSRVTSDLAIKLEVIFWAAPGQNRSNSRVKLFRIHAIYYWWDNKNLREITQQESWYVINRLSSSPDLPSELGSHVSTGEWNLFQKGGDRLCLDRSLHCVPGQTSAFLRVKGDVALWVCPFLGSRRLIAMLFLECNIIKLFLSATWQSSIVLSNCAMVSA